MRFVLLNICFFISALSVQAQVKEVYVVDVQKVIAESIIGKAAKNNLEAEVKKSEARLLSQKQELDKQGQDFNKQKALLSKEAQEQKAQGIRRKDRDLKLIVAEEQDKIKRKNIQEIEKVISKVKEVLEDLAEQKEYDLIVEKDPRLVVYANPKYDITAEVVKALDQNAVE